MKKARFISILFLFGILSGCAANLGNINNACDLLENKRNWYKGLNKASIEWGVPKATILAFIHQESKFKANAKPPRKRLFGFIPTVRPSTAYGFPQALDTTWREYRKATSSIFAQRDDFDDAADFVGWYINGSQRKLGLPVEDVKGHYLAYHEGRGGYAKGTYANKGWLIAVADKVRNRSVSYSTQIAQCESSLSRNRFLIF